MTRYMISSTQYCCLHTQAAKIDSPTEAFVFQSNHCTRFMANKRSYPFWPNNELAVSKATLKARGIAEELRKSQ